MNRILNWWSGAGHGRVQEQQGPVCSLWIVRIHFAHEQICFLCREAFLLTTWQMRHYNSNPPRRKRIWLLKGMGDGHSDWFIACYTQNTPMIN